MLRHNLNKMVVGPIAPSFSYMLISQSI